MATGLTIPVVLHLAGPVQVVTLPAYPAVILHPVP